MSSIREKFNAILDKVPHDVRRDALVYIKMMLPLMFIICVVIYFHEFVLHAIMANVAINCGIIGATTYGIILILNRLINAQGDFKVIERFGREALRGVYMNQLLEEPWMKKRYVRHYLAHIAQTGGTISSQLDQTAIENELHALSAEYESRLELPQFLVGFMIAMGLLGTFIGLLETLTGISGMLDGMGGEGVDIQKQFMKLVTELRKPLAGMGIAFSASMFGLVTSLVLAIMMTNLRRYISRVIALARNTMHNLIELRRPSTQTSSGSQLTPEMLAAASGSPSTSNVMLVSRIDLLTKKIEMLVGSFEQSISASQRLNDLLGFGPRMKETSEKTLEEIKVISLAHAEQQRLSQKMIDVNSNVLKAVTGLVDAQRQTREIGEKSLDGMKAVVNSQGENNRLVQKLLDINGDSIRMLDSILDAQRQIGGLNEKTVDELRTLTASSQEQRQIGQSMLDGMNDSVRTADGTVAAQRQAQSEMVSALRNLGEQLSKIEEVDIGGARHLWEIKENLTKVCTSFSVVEIMSSGISQQTVLLESLVEEIRASQVSLTAIEKSLSGTV